MNNKMLTKLVVINMIISLLTLWIVWQHSKAVMEMSGADAVYVGDVDGSL